MIKAIFGLLAVMSLSIGVIAAEAHNTKKEGTEPPPNPWECPFPNGGWNDKC